MLLNLTDILSNEGKTEEIPVTYESDFFKSAQGQFKVLENGPIVLTLSNQGKGKMRMTGEGSLSFRAKCDRCLTRVDVTVRICIDESIGTEQIENPADADDYPYLNGYQLDTEILISNEILINWPGKILCKEDCKGICTKCGKDLNQGDCGCDNFVPDPRMAVLKDIFNANKEV
jgi:uncharacterized protein